MRIVYLCLQQTRQGQASYAHVHEIVEALRHRAWQVKLHEVAVGDADPGAKTIRRVLSAVRTQFAAILDVRSADLVYIRAHVLAFPLAVLAKALRVPVVHEVNGPASEMAMVRPFLRPFSPLLTWALIRQLRWAAAVVAVTEPLADWVRTTSPRSRVVVIPNGANVEMFLDAPDCPRTSGPYVVFVGAFAPWQGIEYMLEAATCDVWPEGVRLVLAGDGAQVGHVRAAAARTDRIEYVGSVPYAEVPELLAGALAALSVQSSYAGRHRFGVMPLKVFESMAAGTALIVTDIVGQSNVVRRAGCGLVIPVDDAGAIAAAVRELSVDSIRAKAMGDRARRAAVEEHSWRNRADATSELLFEVVSPHHRKGSAPDPNEVTPDQDNAPNT